MDADTGTRAQRRILIGLAGPAAIVVVWQFVYMVVNPALLPSPGATMTRMLELIVSGEIFPDILATFIRMGIAYTLAGAAGIALGLLIGTFRFVYDSFIGVIDFFRSTPVTTLYPVFVLLFGIQHESKIAMTFWACFFVIVLNTAYGALQAGRVRTDMARLYGASRTQVFVWVTFFDSLPQTMIGLRVAISYALIVMILTEMFMGSAAGLGQRVTEAYTTFKLAELYAIVLITGTIGLFLNRIFVVAEERIIPWVGKMSSVVVTGISKSFASETGDPKVVLSGLNFTFEDGLFTSIVGPNGCGKSTLLNLIGGIMRPDAGEIQITTDHGRKPAVGYAWQDYRASLLPWLTVGENICFPLRLRGIGRQERLRVAEEALAGFAKEINLHQPVYSLSGGQQQLVSLLRAMVANPDVLLLDEPLSALDQSAGWTMASRIEQMWMQKRMPAIFVSHEIDEAVMLADRVVLMKSRGGGVADTIEHSMPRPRSVKMLTSEEHIRSRKVVIEFLFQEGAIRDAEE